MVRRSAPTHLKIWPLTNCGDADVSEIGTRAKVLCNLHLAEVRVPDAYIVPITFLNAIAEANHLRRELDTFFATTDWHDSEWIANTSHHIERLILSQKFPEAAASTLLDAYTQWLDGHFIAVRPSFVQPVPFDHFSDLHVKGEANLAESILRVWARLYQPAHLHQRFLEWQKKIFIPAAMVLQQMVEATAAGVVEVHAPDDPKLCLVHSVWGVHKGHDLAFVGMDHFLVNPESGLVHKHTIVKKPFQYIQHLDRLERQGVPEAKQSQASVSDAELKKLAQLTQTLVSHLPQLESFEWAIEKQEMYVLHVVASAPVVEAASEQSEARRTAFQKSKPNLNQVKVGISLELDQAEHHQPIAVKEITGPVVVSSDALVQGMGVHPEYLLAQRRAHLLKEKIVGAALSVHHHYSHLPLLYRPLFINPNTMSQLEHGAEYEHTETNPVLGYRGGIRFIQQPAILDFELDVLADIHEQSGHKVGLLLPMMRNPSELILTIKHILRPEYHAKNMLDLWLECDTPANLIHFQQYLSVDLAGAIVNCTWIHALSTGIDPSKVATGGDHYPYDFSLLRSLTEPAQKLAHAAKISFYLSSGHQVIETMQLAQEITADGIIVPAGQASVLHTTQSLAYTA